MTAAIAAMIGAAVETELAHRAQRAGAEALHRKHGGWAVILLGVGLFCALLKWIFG